jgi:uncharacterized membrane protein
MRTGKSVMLKVLVARKVSSILALAACIGVADAARVGVSKEKLYSRKGGGS